MWQVDIYHFGKTDFIKLYKATTKRSMNKLFWFKKILAFKISSLYSKFEFQITVLVITKGVTKGIGGDIDGGDIVMLVTL